MILLKELEEMNLKEGDLIEFDYYVTASKKTHSLKGILQHVFENEHRNRGYPNGIPEVRHYVHVQIKDAERFIDLYKMVEGSLIRYDDNDALLFKLENNI